MPRLNSLFPCLLLIAALWTPAASLSNSHLHRKLAKTLWLRPARGQFSKHMDRDAGIEGRSSPSFYGAGTSEFDPVPVFSLRPEGKTARFRSIRDSSGIALFQSTDSSSAPLAASSGHERKGTTLTNCMALAMSIGPWKRGSLPNTGLLTGFARERRCDAASTDTRVSSVTSLPISLPRWERSGAFPEVHV